MLNSAVSSAPPSYVEMKSKIIHENLKKSTGKDSQTVAVHYSICNKQSKNVSILTHERVLILNEGQGILYYANEIKNTPFVTYDKLPKPKNYFAHLNLCVVKQQNPQSNILTILFNVKVKGQANPQGVQWKFEMGNKQLAFNWQQMVREKKIQRMTKAIGIDTKDKNTLGTIHDTLSFTLLGVPASSDKISPIKNKQDQLQQADQKGMTSFLMNFGDKSKVENKEQKQIEASKTSILDKPVENQIEKPLLVSQVANKDPKAFSQYKQNKPKSTQQQKLKIPLLSQQVIDWNIQYLKMPNQNTLTKFAQFAKKTVLGMKIETVKFKGRAQLQQLEQKFQSGLNIRIAKIGSQHAKKMQEEFQNYNYIARCLIYSAKPCINIPLACIIEYKGVLALAKSSFPKSAKTIQRYKLKQQNPFTNTILSYFKQLQKHTKIESSVLINNCIILNLTTEYGLNKSLPNIFIDEVNFYLPYYPQISSNSIVNSHIEYPNDVQVRAEIITNSFTKIIKSSPIEQQKKTREQLAYYINQSLKQVTRILISQQKIICSHFDIKQIMNEHGLGIQMLPHLYYSIDTQLKKGQCAHVKALINTVLAARFINATEQLPLMDQLRESHKINEMEDALAGIIKKYCQGGSALNEESWKRLSIQFNKQYGFALKFDQIQGGILLSTLIDLTQAQINLNNINKSKKLMKDQDIIKPGVIAKIIPKLTYFSYVTIQSQQIKQLCDNTSISNVVNQLKKYGGLENWEKLKQHLNSQTDKYLLLQIASYHIKSLTNKSKLLDKILLATSLEPPQSQSTHIIAINQFKYWLSDDTTVSNKEKEKYKQRIQKYMQIISYWLGSEHPYLCDIFDCLIQYYYCNSQLQHRHNKMRNYANQSLQISKKMCGIYNYRTADKYVKFGMFLLMQGNTIDAKLCFNQAKNTYESQIGKFIEQYALLTNKLAKLELESGNVDDSIIMAQTSNKMLKNIQQININRNIMRHNKICFTVNDIQKTAIQNYLVMARAYEVRGNKQGLIEIGRLMEELLKQQIQPILFDQMLKVSLLGFLSNLSTYQIHKLYVYTSILFSIKNKQINGKSFNKSKLVQRLVHSPTSIFDKIHHKLQTLQQVNQIQQIMNNAKAESMEARQFRQLWEYICGSLGVKYVLTAIENTQQI